MSGHLSTLKLHQLRYGELSSDLERDARVHIAECDRCRARLGAQEQQRRAFEASPVPESIQQLESNVIRPRFPVWGGAALAIAAAVLLMLRMAPAPTETIKGGDGVMEAWIEDAEGAHALEVGELVHAGDRIQLKFKRPPLQQVALAGVDATGVTEVYGQWTAEQEPSRWQAAPFALRLDDTPGDVQMVLVFSKTTLSERQVVAAAEGQPGAGVHVRRVLLDKE
ncbi:MAG: hypothetical protein KC912_02705 [Proteobacteria bacterium]|nr:hypothetical protein [Pseudomonadota bacterium]